jgi:polyisoprenoid-binding protein YceI
MEALRLLVPLLVAMSLAACGGASAQGVLIDKSEIRFVTKQLGANVEGRFRSWKANVDFRPNDLAHSSAAFEIELASIDLASDESEAEVKGPLWFDAARFPVAKFSSSVVRDLGGGRYEVAGKLTLKGTARAVVVPVTLKQDAAGNSVAEGQFTVKRLDFGIGQGMWADTGTVADDVVVRLRMVLPPAT